MSLRDITHSWRGLRRAPVFTAAVVLTLTIGIAAATAIFAVVNAVVIRPLPYKDPGRLAGIWLDMAPMALTHTQQTPGTYLTFKRYAHTLDDVALYQTTSTNALDPDGPGNPQRVAVAMITANTLTLLGVPPILGRTFTDAEDVPRAPVVVVISEGLWRSRYGANRNVLGKKLLLSGRSATIVGVMPAAFRFPSTDIAAWIPLHLDVANPVGGFGYTAIARLKTGVSPDAAQRDLAAVLPRVVEIVPMLAASMTMQQVLDQAKPVPRVIPLREDTIGDVARTLWMVAATAVLLLIVTGANVANLLLVRADARQRELAVRAALGAGQRRVLSSFFVESGLLAAISVALGLVAATYGIHLLVNASSAQIPRLEEVHVDLATVLFAVAVGAIITVACSLLPAIRFARSDALRGLRDGGRGGTVGGRRQRARATLVAAQMAMALVVLATSALLYRSFQHLRAMQPGFSARGVATLWVGLPRDRYASEADIVRFYAALTENASHLPGAVSAAVTSRLPLNDRGSNHNPVYVDGIDAPDKKIPLLSLYGTASPGYFDAMRIPLVAGRTFSPVSAGRGDEAIISLEAARFYFHDSTGRTAIGRVIRELANSAPHTVVGVVGNVRDTSLADPPARSVYFPEVRNADTTLSQVTSPMALVVRTNGDIGQMTRAMQAAVHDLDPTLPTFDVRPLQATVDASMARVTFMMIIVAVAAAVTLVLSIIGLYAVIAYIVTLRTREIGVRIALGAQPAAVAAMVARQGLVLCVVGVIAGIAIIAAVTRFLRAFLFEVAPGDPVSIGAAALLLVLFALIASWLPARRAARVDPMLALRAE